MLAVHSRVRRYRRAFASPKDRSPLGHAVVIAAWVLTSAIAAGLILNLLVLFLTALTLPSDRTAFRDDVRAAFEESIIPTNPDWYTNVYNECLILSSLVSDYPSTLVETLTIKPAIGCHALHAMTGGDDAGAEYYNRYLNGWRIYYAVALRLSDVRGAFLATQWTGYALLIVGLAISVLRLRSAWGVAAEHHGDRLECVGFIAIFLAFLLFFGWDRFGNRPTFALPSILLFVMIIWLSTGSKYALGIKRLSLIFALFGAATAQFDFFTGPAPLAFAVTIGALSLQIRDPDRDTVKMLAAGAALVGGFAAAFVSKYAVLYTVLGPEFLEGTVSQLADRVSSAYLDKIDISKLDQLFPSWRDYIDYPLAPVALLAGKLLYSSESIGLGSRIVGSLVILLSLSIICYFVVAETVRKRFGSVQVWATVASVVVIAVWIALFFQHTIIHTRYMVRLFVWPIAIAFFILGVYLVDRRREQQSAPH